MGLGSGGGGGNGVNKIGPGQLYSLTKSVEELLEHWGSLPDETLSSLDQSTGASLAFYAALRRPDEEAERLLTYLCLDRKVCDAAYADKNLQTAAFFAARDGNLKAVDFLGRHGCDLNAQDSAGQTALFYACREGRDDVVERMCNHFGVPVDHVDRVGQTALFYAAREGHISTITLMLRLGADPKQRDWQKKCPHSYAQKRGHHEAAAALKTACALEVPKKKGSSEQRQKYHLQRELEIEGNKYWLFASEADAIEFEDKFPELAGWSRMKSQTFLPVDGFKTDWGNACLEIVYLVSHYEDGWLFSQPVDTKAWNCPDYYNVISQPRDLSMIKKKLRGLEYVSIKDFVGDMNLIFTNCFKYNSPTSQVHQAGKKVELFWKKLYEEKNVEGWIQREEKLFRWLDA